MSSVNISNQNVQVNPTTTENKINVVTTTENNISVTQPSIQTVEVLTGPQGPVGPSGSQGPQGDPFPYTGDAIITGSLTLSGSIFSTNNISASNGIYSSTSIKAETIFRLGDDAFFRASPAILHLGLGSSTCAAISTERDCIQFRTSTATGFGGIIPFEIHDNYIELNSPVTASGNVSSSATSTAPFGTYLGDGSQLSGISTTPFPFSGSAIITGSLTVSQSVVDFTSASAVLLNIEDIPLVNPIVEYVDAAAVTASGTTITLPNSLSYVSSSTYEYLEVFINGLRLRYNRDFIPISDTSVRFDIAIPSGSEVTYKSLKRP